MKRFRRFLATWLVVVFAASLTVTVPAVADGAELVEGGDFENGVGAFAAPNTTASVSTDFAHSGSQSLKAVRNAEIPDANDVGVNYTVSLKAGKKYNLSAWVRCDPAAPVPSNVYLRFADSSFNFNDRAIVRPAGSDDFTKLSVTYTPQSDENARINIGFGGTGQVTVYVDDVSCVEEALTPSYVLPGNLLGDNASFEMGGTLPTVYNGTAVADSKYANRGSNSLRIEHNGSDNEFSLNYFNLDLTAGKTYRFGAYVRFDEDTPQTGQFYMAMFSPSYQTAYSSKLDKNTGFTFISVIVTATETAAGTRGKIGLSAKGGAIGYVDDVVFEEVTLPGDTVEGNLLKDGSFEGKQEGGKTEYTFDPNAAYVTATDNYDPQYVHSGEYAVRAQQLTPGGCLTFETAAEPGVTYTFGAWVRFDESVADQSQIYLRDYVANKLTFTNKIDGTDDYQFISHTVTTGPSDSKVKFQLKADTGDGSDPNKIYTFYVDDVSLVQQHSDLAVGEMKLEKEAGGSWGAVEYDDLSAGARRFTVSGINNQSGETVNLKAALTLYNGDTVAAKQEETLAVANGVQDQSIAVTLNLPSGGTKLVSTLVDADTGTSYKPPMRVLVIGNSITQHDVAPGKGWPHDWGMAATKEENDYVHRLIAKMKVKEPEVEVRWKNIYEFEKYFYDFTKFDTASYQSLVDFDADVIICTIGANIKNATPEGDSGVETEEIFTKERYKAIIDFFNSDGKAKVIAGTTIFTPDSGEVAPQIKAAADAYGYSFVKMNDLTDKKYTAWPYQEQLPDAINGVLDHPGDEGMRVMAIRLWKALEPLMEKLGASGKSPEPETENPDPMPGEETELIATGTFEESMAGFSVGNAKTAELSNAYAHGGTQSLKVVRDETLANDKQVGVNYTVNLKKGKTYTISAWVRFDPNQTVTGDKLYYIRFAGETGFQFADRGVVNVSESDEFQKVSVDYTPEADETGVRLNIGMGATGAAIGYIDDVSCIEKDAGDSEPEPEDKNELVLSGTFEKNMVGFTTTNTQEAALTTDYAHGGTQSLKVVRTASAATGQQVGINYKVNLKANKTYVISAWVRYDPNQTIEKGREFYIRLTDNTAFAFADRGVTNPAVTDDFTQIRAEYTPTKDENNVRLNISMGGEGTVTGYIDDVSCYELGEPIKVTSASWNKLGDEGQLAVCPTRAEAVITFDGELDAASLTPAGVTVSGVDASAIEVTPDPSAANKVTIAFNRLSYGKRYKVELTGWKDKFGRALAVEPLSFKVSGKVFVGSKKFYNGDSEITNGVLTAGTKVRVELGGLKNISGETTNVSAILALFRNGELIDGAVGTKQITADENGSDTVTTEFQVPADLSDGSYELRLFVWDDLKGGLSLGKDTAIGN